MFGLVDGNSFYASCERAWNPRLKGKPVIVLSNNDGNVVARNTEAKAVGIQMGQPFFEVKPLLAGHDVQVFSSNYTLYGDMSRRMMEILKTFTPDLEIYSIDEAFLGLQGFAHLNLEDYARKIRQTVRQYIGIPTCIGIAPTKTLAKIANRLAKKSPDGSGVRVLDTAESQQEALQQTPVENIWGIGRQYAAKLRSAGIHDAWQLSQQPAEWARRHLGGVVGMRLIQELRGISCIQLELFPQPKKAIACTRSFGRRVTSLEDLSEALSTYVTRAAEKLRSQHSCVNILTVFVGTNAFNPTAEQYSASTNVTLPVPSNDTSELIRYALSGLKQLYREGMIYKKTGVIFNALVPASQVQASLFDEVDRPRSAQLMSALDKVNARMGKNTVGFASSGVKKPWQMQRRHGSPRYTTNWEELPIVQA